MFLYDSVPILFEPTFDVLFRSNCFLTMLCFCLFYRMCITIEDLRLCSFYASVACIFKIFFNGNRWDLEHSEHPFPRTRAKERMTDHGCPRYDAAM